MQKEMSFYNMLKENAEKYGDKTAILYDTYEVSYNRLFEDAVKKALHLQRFEGRKIAIYGPASYRWIVNLFGTLLAGKDIVLVNFFWQQEAREKMLAKVGVDYILCSTNQYILSDAHAVVIPNADQDNVDGLSYDTGTQEGNILAFTATGEEEDKAVVLTPSNVLNAADSISRLCRCREQDRMLTQIPVDHVFGFIYGLIFPLYSGVYLCIGRGLRHMDSDTYYYEPTILPANLSMVKYLKKIRAFNDSLRMIILNNIAGEDALPDILRQRGLEVYTVYGTDECACCVALNRDSASGYELYGSDSVEIAADGEILVRSSCVMQGYYGDEQANARVLENGMFHTGDKGHLTGDGRLAIDRRNPAILLLQTGEKICKQVINDEVAALSGIAESYVALYDGRLTAVAVPIDRKAEAERIRRKVRQYNEQKGFRWEIQKIHVLDRALPRTPDGSIDEASLEELIAGKAE